MNLDGSAVHLEPRSHLDNCWLEPPWGSGKSRKNHEPTKQLITKEQKNTHAETILERSGSLCWACGCHQARCPGLDLTDRVILREPLPVDFSILGNYTHTCHVRVKRGVCTKLLWTYLDMLLYVTLTLRHFYFFHPGVYTRLFIGY